MESVIILYLSCLCLILPLVLLISRLFIKQWWMPTRMQALMRSRGIRGPPYKFLYGNIKEILEMRNETMSGAMEFSHDIYYRIQPHIYSWIKQYGKTFLSWNGCNAELVVAEPDLVKEILSNKDESYPKAEFEPITLKISGDGLAHAEGEKWQRQRKLATQAFMHAESLRGMFPGLIASVEIMFERWRKNESKEIEVSQEFKILTAEIISRTAFGSSYAEGESIFSKLMNMVFFVTRNDNAFKTKVSLRGTFAKNSDHVEADKLEQGIRDTIVEMIKKREEKAMKGELSSYGNDYFGLLLKAYHDPDMTKKISFDDIIDECKTFFLAGHDTTSHLLTWTIWLLALHTDWQEKLRKEVLELFGHQNPTVDDMGKLKTMSLVINESLRLYPPTVILQKRKVKREVKLRNYILPADMEITIPILAMHHDPEIWGEDAHLFKPERFAEGIAKATNNNQTAFLPFGSGPRVCVGFNFAPIEAKIVLSMILQRYKFNLSPTYVHSPYLHVTLRPQSGLQIMFQPSK